MNLKEISLIRRMAYLWRNLRNRFSYSIGPNNQVINRGGQKVGSIIQINGDGNKVVLEKNAMFLNSRIKISGSHNIVVLERNSYISGAELWVENDNCELKIGERTFVGHHSHLACTENGCKLLVGSDSMISSYVQIRTGDSHSIISLDGVRINPAQSVIIGEHCWIGEGAKVLKGVVLAGDNVVATGAIVTKSFGKNVLLGGVPAAELKNNITWDKKRL